MAKHGGKLTGHRGTIQQRLGKAVDTLELGMKLAKRLHEDAVQKQVNWGTLQIRAEAARLTVKQAMITLGGIAEELWEQDAQEIAKEGKPCESSPT